MMLHFCFLTIILPSLLLKHVQNNCHRRSRRQLEFWIRRSGLWDHRGVFRPPSGRKRVGTRAMLMLIKAACDCRTKRKLSKWDSGWQNYLTPEIVFWPDYSWTRRDGLCVYNIDAWSSHNRISVGRRRVSWKPSRLFLNETDPAVPLFKVLDDFSAETDTFLPLYFIFLTKYTKTVF